jgi:aspartate/methionine/tyrosine aminotransferase/uncharacterized protein (DUF849 family)
VALTGDVPKKKSNPNVPCSPEEIANDVRECYAAGARVFHLHARDPVDRDQPTHDLNIYRETVKIIKDFATKDPTFDPILQLSTGVRANGDWAARSSIVQLLPEMASFCTGSNNLDSQVYHNDPAFILKLAQVFKDTGVTPSVECFDAAHVSNALYLVKKGLLSLPIHFEFVLNTAGGARGHVDSLTYMAQMVPEGSTWSTCALGKMQFPLAAAAMAMGGHVRTGLEDNLFDPEGRLTSNVALVNRVVDMARSIGRPIATATQARDVFHLPTTNKDRITPYLEKDGSVFAVRAYTQRKGQVDWSAKDLQPHLIASDLASPTLKINEKSNALREGGQTVYRVGFGESPFPIPTRVRKTLEKALRDETYQYPPTGGIPELREAVANQLMARYSIPDLDADDIFVSGGAKMMIQHLMQMMDAEVLVPTPCWVTYTAIARVLGQPVTKIPCDYSTHWKVDADRLDRQLSESKNTHFKRRVLMLNNPHNPTGSVYSFEELEALTKVLRKHNVLVLSDEIYATLRLNGIEHVSLAHKDLYPENTLVLTGMSKSYGGGGWRIGAVAIPKSLSFLRPVFATLANNSYTAAATPLQIASVEAYKDHADIIEYERKNRDILAPLGLACHKIMDEAGVLVHKPEGAYYMYPDFSPFVTKFHAAGMTTGELAMLQLLEQKGVAMLSGIAWGQGADAYTARFCFVDFDGSKALDALGPGQVADDAFLKEYCNGPIEASKRIAEWVNAL